MFQAVAPDGENDIEIFEIRSAENLSSKVVLAIERTVPLISFELQESIQMEIWTVRVKTGNLHFQITEKGKQRKMIDLRIGAQQSS